MKELGIVVINLRSFKKFLKVPHKEEKFRKANFAIFDKNESKIGTLEISLCLQMIKTGKKAAGFDLSSSRLSQRKSIQNFLK